VSRSRLIAGALPCLLLAACAAPRESGTLAELGRVEPDVEDIQLDDGLERAAASYRRYLNETPESARTPEAMRRLADLQIEQEFGVLGSGDGPVEKPVIQQTEKAPTLTQPKTAMTATPARGRKAASVPADTLLSERQLEQRASAQTKIQPLASDALPTLAHIEPGDAPAGPLEAIQTYREILATYPNYERNDQVLYQMSRAFDEIGQPDEAMAVMNRLVAEYPHSRFVDEVHFRRGEYLFVRKKYRQAEDAYGAVINLGATSSYYELALYKMGWSLYKQEFYEEALHNYVAMLDHRLEIGYDFDGVGEEDDEHRLADTFRVISLSFSNLGGPEVIDEYFAEHGHRSYADKIYANLGEFFFAKLRYDDAASVYKSFFKLNPYHRVSPHFSMRVVEIYEEAAFPQLVLESKKQFATDYGLETEYWNRFAVEESPEVVGFLKVNLKDLANHYHALYQEEELAEEKPSNFAEASRWYQEFLASFPGDDDTPQINYQLADLLLEDGDFGAAAREYERTAYDYDPHDQDSAAGYAAVYAHRQHLEAATGVRALEVKKATVTSSLRFAETFPEHDEAPIVLGAAADDLYQMEDFPLARESAQKLIDRYPAADPSLLRSAWAVKAHSSIDLADYAVAEHAYLRVLDLTDGDDESRPAIVDGLAAAVYKQGEQANLLEDYGAAASHFLRIKDVAPTSTIRAAAEYDAAAALMKAQDFAGASGVLEEFRVSHPEHELSTEATKQLAHIYREDGQTERSAAEHERIAAEATDPDLAREALLTAGELYDEASVHAEAIRVYEQYVAAYPRPLDTSIEIRSRLAELFKDRSDLEGYYAALAALVAADREANDERTDRSKFLAAKAALVLAERSYQQHTRLVLVQPFEQSLAAKQQSLDTTLAELGALVEYEVADVTAAATFYIAEVYLDFSHALLDSERPTDLNEKELADYELMIEEEAYPFEERAIEVHEENLELLTAGVYNSWIEKTLSQLASLMPGRYAKAEISSGFVGSINSYAYRMPIAPTITIDPVDDEAKPDGATNPIEVTARISTDAVLTANHGATEQP
jgi:TolA-binding protein